jgi:hypothetical protein
MSDTYKLNQEYAYTGTGTIIYCTDRDGDKHEIVIAGLDAFSLATFLRESGVMADPDESKFQKIQITKAL